MKAIAIITGKKNSSFKNKNIIKIFNKEIFLYPVDAAKKSKYLSEFYTSSDSKKILNVSRKKGFKSINRPSSLSRKNSKHSDVLAHALKNIKNLDDNDIVVVLLANCATITTDWIDNCISKIKKDKSLSAVVPVTLDNDHHPLRAKKLKNGKLTSFFKNKKKISSNRQDLENNYFLSHNFWVIKKKYLVRQNGEPPWQFMGPKVAPYVLDFSIDIHNKRDVYLTKMWLKTFMKI